MGNGEYCIDNKCPWYDEKRDICASPNDIHGGKCDFDNGIFPVYDDEEINLKLVTWNGDLTQFLVEADTNMEAIHKAIKANFLYCDPGDDNDIRSDMQDKETYEVEEVDFKLLSEIFERTDCAGTYGEAVVFND